MSTAADRGAIPPAPFPARKQERKEPYVPLTMGVIQGYKAKLEEDLCSRIQEFETLTGCRVSYVHLSRFIIEKIGCAPTDPLQKVDTTVNVP